MTNSIHLPCCFRVIGIAGLLAAAFIFTPPQGARAADGTWTQLTSGGLWSAGGNWSGGTVADGSGATADFNTLNITADNTVHLDSARTIGNLIFGDITTASNGWILDNNANAANILTLAGGTPTITVNALGSGKTALISAVIDGTAGLTKAGTGTLVLTGANTYTGITTISLGGLLQIGAGSTTGSINSGSSVVNNATATNTGLAFNRSDAITFSNAISGAGRVNQNGAGTLVLTNAANSYTGVTALAAGTTIRGADSTVYTLGTNNSQVLGNGSTIGFSNNSTVELRANGLNDSSAQTITFKNTPQLSAAGTISVNVDRESATGGTGKTLGFSGTATIASSGTLNVTGGAGGFNLSLSALTVGSGGVTGNVTLNPTTANLTIAGNATSSGSTNAHGLILDGSSSANSIAGNLLDGSGAPSVLSVSKTNSSTWTVSGASSNYTGSTTVTLGTLIASSNKALGNSSGVTVNGGTLDIRGSTTAGTLTLGTGSNFTLSSGSIKLQLGTAFDSLVSSGAGTFTITGGTFALDVTGAGFGYANTYQVLSGFGGSNSVSGLAFTGYNSAGYTASLSTAGLLSFTAVPEPSTWALLAFSLTTVVILRRRRA